MILLSEVFYHENSLQCRVGISQLVHRLAMGRTVLGSNPSGVARFSAPIQTGLGAHPASYTMGTGSFLGCGVDHLPPSRAEVKERVELYLFSLSGPSWLVLR
jgi:hypothetical protein